MDDFISREEAAYRLDIPLFKLDEMIEEGTLPVHTTPGHDILIDTFRLSTTSGYRPLAPDLSHVQECLAKCEEGPP